MQHLEDVDLADNMLTVWPDELDYSKCQIKTFDASYNAKLQKPPPSLLKDS